MHLSASSHVAEPRQEGPAVRWSALVDTNRRDLLAQWMLGRVHEHRRQEHDHLRPTARRQRALHLAIRVGQGHDHARVPVRHSSGGDEAIREQPAKGETDYDISPRGESSGSSLPDKLMLQPPPQILFVLNWHEELKRLVLTR